MRMTLYLLFLTISVISLTGCEGLFCPEPPEPKVVVEYKYIKPNIPNIPEKPKAKEYKTIIVNFQGVDYIAYDKENAGIVASNYESHRIWSNTIYTILKKAKEGN